MDDGQFCDLTVCSIQRNRSACRVLRAGQAATLALGEFDRSLLRKVCVRLCVQGMIRVEGLFFFFSVLLGTRSFFYCREWWWWVRRWIPLSAGCLKLRLYCSFMLRLSTRASKWQCTWATWDRRPQWRLCKGRWDRDCVLVVMRDTNTSLCLSLSISHIVDSYLHGCYSCTMF